MGFAHKLSGAMRQAKNALTTHQSSIERGIDKAADLANNKTGAKHDQHIRKGTDHLRTGLGKITGNPSAGSPGTGSVDDQPLSREPYIDGQSETRSDDDGHNDPSAGPRHT